MADTKLATLSSVSGSVLLSSTAGAGAGVGEVSGGSGSLGGAAVISGCRTSGADVVPFPASVERTVALTGGRVDLTEPV